MDPQYNDLRRLAADIRIETIRMMEHFGSGHIGGAASIADALAVLYGSVMKYRPDQPDWEQRDRLVMSKGHCGPALYAALALKGFFPREWLKTLNQGGTRLPSHCDRNKTPGIDASTGSLGQGASIGCGLALGSRMKGMENMTFVLLGDGELQEGQVWEAAQFAAHRRLGRLVFLIDHNGMQLDGALDEICAPGDIAEKFRAFGWNACSVRGWDVEQLDRQLKAICQTAQDAARPSAVVLKTRKGIGCLFAEKAALCHHMAVGKSDADEAVQEIERRLAAGLYPGGERDAILEEPGD